MMLIFGITDNAKTGTTKGLSSGDDTFMKMLSEKIAERKNNRLQPQLINRKMNLTESRVLNDDSETPNDTGYVNDTGPVYNKKPGPEADKLDKGFEKVAEASGQETEDLKDGEEEIREKISSLEALIALLEELMARLSLKDTQVAAKPSNASQELTLWAENKEISPMELLMALVRKDAVKLEAIMKEAGNSINTPEINQLLEKIQALLEKLADDKNMPLLKVEVAGENVGMEELIEQLKDQCRQLIDKLNEQVSELNASLNEEAVGEEPVLSETVKTGPGARHDSKDAEGGSSAHAEDAEAIQVKTYADTDNYFENIIAQNNPIPEKSPAQPEVIEKMQLPFSEKPLAHTVTNQVIMKLKLMAGESKQEMEMHLKPESLGRLTLKIIHERGEILARITAENQQVKAILENNMQMLKDALEKNGLNVQDLSVSVGNDSDARHNRESRDDKGIADSVGLRRMTGISSQPDTDKLRLRTRIEKEYFKDTSHINLTA